jgi:hypothetical protein
MKDFKDLTDFNINEKLNLEKLPNVSFFKLKKDNSYFQHF